MTSSEATSLLITQLIGVHNIKNSSSKQKSMKVCIKSVHDVRSQKPLRPISWFLFVGILQSGMGFNRKNKCSSNV